MDRLDGSPGQPDLMASSSTMALGLQLDNVLVPSSLNDCMIL